MNRQQEQWCGLSAYGSPITPPPDNSYFPTSFFFSTDDAPLSDVMGQSLGDYPCFEPFFDDSLSPGELGGDMMEGFSPASSSPSDGHDAFLGMQWTSDGLVAPEPPATAGPTRLRTSGKPSKQTSTKPGKPTTADKQSSSSRQSHNQVEKKYRDRLNDQFERLLDTLAASPECVLDDDSQRPMSKSAVLALARRRLLALGKENMQLAADVERLNGLLQLR